MRNIIILLALIACAFAVRSQVLSVSGNQFYYPSTPVITPTVGAVINGYNVISSPSYTTSTAIELFTANSNTIIENKTFNSMSNPIKLWECGNITIRNCKFKNITGAAISIENGQTVTIYGCVFDSCSNGVKVSANASNAFNGGINSGITVLHNYFKNTMGGSVGYHAVQLTSCNGPGIKVNYNTFENIHLQSHVDDIVSCFNTYGSISDSIQVIGNWFRGGDYNTPNHTGGAVTIGDNGSSYIHVKNNVIINVVGGGIGLAGGHDITVENNTLYQSQALANPLNQTDGLIMYNFDAIPSSATCYSNTIQNNRVYYLDSNGNPRNYNSANKNCLDAAGTSTNVSDPTLTESILPVTINNLYHY